MGYGKARYRKWLMEEMGGSKTITTREEDDYTPNFDKATSDALTANDNSIGSSGGTTLVTMRMQSNNNFDFLSSLSIPSRSHQGTGSHIEHENTTHP